MKLSVSLPVDDVAFLDEFAQAAGMDSRSAVLQRAIAMLRAAGLRHLDGRFAVQGYATHGRTGRGAQARHQHDLVAGELGLGVQEFEHVGGCCAPHGLCLVRDTADGEIDGKARCHLRIGAAQLLQSDEGGRFLRSISRYSVDLLDASVQVPEIDGCVWMPLSTVHAVLQQQGVFTNEARSALSLLLGEL